MPVPVFGCGAADLINVRMDTFNMDDIPQTKEMMRLCEALAAIIKPQYIGEWLKTPSELFDGLSALEVIERGEIDRVWRMVYHIQAGAQS